MIPAPEGVHGLQLADVQHPPHQAAEAAALVGDDLQILLLVFRRDGAVQDAVGIAGDGGHGGFQLVGDVGDKLPALPLRLLKAFRHVVEGGRQFADLILPAVVVHADVEIALGILPGGLGHLPDGLDLPHGGDGGGHEGDHQHHKGGHQQQSRKGPPQIVNGCGGGHSEHRPQGFSAGGIHHRHAADELLVLIDLVQAAAAGPGAVGEDLLHDGLGDVDGLACHGLIGGEEHMAVGIADQNVHLGDDGGGSRQLAELLVLLQFLHGEVAPGLQIPDGQLAHRLGPHQQFVGPLAPGIVVAQGEEGNAHQHQRQGHHAHGDGHLPPVKPVEMLMEPFHMLTSSPPSDRRWSQTCSQRPRRSSGPTGR